MQAFGGAQHRWGEGNDYNRQLFHPVRTWPMQVEPATGGLGDGLFVGRQHEIEQLEATFEEAASGRPRLAFLVGEPGIGKTATAQEFAQRVSGAGAMVLWGSCYEGEGAAAYGRWLQDAKVLILATYRQGELGRQHPLSDVLGRLTMARRLVLGGLARPEVEHFIEVIAGVSPTPPLVDTVHAMTAGNPFFLGEVLRLLASEGRLGG